MSFHESLDRNVNLDRLAKAAAALGCEIVDIAGFLDLVDAHAKNQREALDQLGKGAQEMDQANADVTALIDTLSTMSDQALQEVQSSVAIVRNAEEKTQGVATWVKILAQKSSDVSDVVRAVQASNAQIAKIAMQVNTLAINAKIEAARAGDAGRGFAVVADAINELSRQTGSAAKQITQNISDLSGWVGALQEEADDIARDAQEVLAQSAQTDTALGRMESTIHAEHEQTAKISECTQRLHASMAQFKPAVTSIHSAVRETTHGIGQTHRRMNQLIDDSESIVQTVSGIGGTTVDAPFIAKVRETAQAISENLDFSIKQGRVAAAQLFDQSYIPVKDSGPVQYTTQASAFFDSFLPPFQEPVLEFDSKVVFCAAVDSKGYLPTHNQKFSHPQGDDPIWNAAHCRNKRIFDDRVGLKAGSSTAPFLLQVYRRDMGGGDFRMMKDLSAPIFVQGRHWGGLRLAYGYENT